MKYVIGIQKITEYYLPVVFPDELVHIHVAVVLNKANNCRIHSAGFVNHDGEKWVIDSEDKSTSLKIGPKPGDETILRFFLQEGLSGLALNNMLALGEIAVSKSGDKLLTDLFGKDRDKAKTKSILEELNETVGQLESLVGVAKKRKGKKK